jgi:hypothetical protein
VRIDIVKGSHVVVTRHWVIHARAERRFAFAAPRAPFQVHVHIEPTFTPSQFGRPDTRQLGAQVTFLSRAQRH